MTLRAPSDGTISLLSIWHNGGKARSKPVNAHGRVRRLRNSLTPPRCALRRVSTKQNAGDWQWRSRSRCNWMRLPIASSRAGWSASAPSPPPTFFGLAHPSQLRSGDWHRPGRPRLKPGMTVQITVIVGRVPDAITIPAQASFLKSGRTVAYVWNGSAFQERVIQIERRSRDRILVSSGLKQDDLVALQDPTGKE